MINKCPNCGSEDVEDCEPRGDVVEYLFCNNCKRYINRWGDTFEKDE